MLVPGAERLAPGRVRRLRRLEAEEARDDARPEERLGLWRGVALRQPLEADAVTDGRIGFARAHPVRVVEEEALRPERVAVAVVRLLRPGEEDVEGVAHRERRPLARAQHDRLGSARHRRVAPVEEREVPAARQRRREDLSTAQDPAAVLARNPDRQRTAVHQTPAGGGFAPRQATCMAATGRLSRRCSSTMRRTSGSITSG